MSRSKTGMTAVLLTITMSACVSAPPKLIAAHDPILDKGGGVALVVDVCVRRAPMSGDNYYVLNESRTGAEALAEAAHSYLTEHGVKVRTVLIPFMCGMGAGNNPIRKIADRVDGEVITANPPFAVAPQVADDRVYIDELVGVSTAIVLKEQAEKKAAKSTSNKPTPYFSPGLSRAAAVINARTGSSSLVYVGVIGSSLSAEATAASTAGRFMVGVLTGLTTRSVSVTPGGKVDGRQMFAGAVNLESGNIIWSNSTVAYGDPVNPATVANKTVLESLMTSLVRQPASPESAAAK